MQTDPSMGFELPQQTSQFRMNGECVQPVSSGRVQRCVWLCLVTLNSPIHIDVLLFDKHNNKSTISLKHVHRKGRYDAPLKRWMRGCHFLQAHSRSPISQKKDFLLSSSFYTI